MITAKKVVSYGSVILLIAIIIGYGIWRSRDLLFGIKLTATGISDGMTTTESLLDFSGTAHHANGITVNGETVPLSGDGEWHDTIALLDGYNVVTVTATDRFGRTISKTYRVYYNKQ
jgi:hypothetical protein